MDEENTERDGEVSQETPEDQLAKLKALISSAKAEAEEAKRLLTLCQLYETDIRGIKEKAQTDKSEVDTNKGAVEQAVKAVSDFEQKAAQTSETIEGKLKSIEDSIQKMETAFTEFEKINSKVADPVTGLDGTLKVAQELKTQIEAEKIEADTHLKQITENLSIWVTRIQEMDSAFNEFELVKSKVFNEENGLGSIFNKAQNLRDDILKLKGQVESYEKKVVEDSQNIDSLRQKAQEDSDNIVITLRAMIGKGLGTHFDNRKEVLSNSVSSWQKAVLASFGLLAVAVFLLFGIPGKIGVTTPENLSPMGFVIFRIAITSPVLFLVGFCLAQYSKDRDLLERYAFKAVKGFTLEAYTTVLYRTFNINEKQIQREVLDFVLDSMRNIYEEPFHPVSKLEVKKEKISTITSAINSKIENGKKTIEESTETEKEVKQAE